MIPKVMVEALQCQMCETVWVPRKKGFRPRRCVNPDCRSRRWDVARYPNAGPPQPTPTLRGRKASASDKRGRVGILLNSRPQLRLPLSIAASLLISVALVLVSPMPSRAASPAQSSCCPIVEVTSASLEDNPMPAKAVLRKVVHRRLVPFIPYAHVPDYIFCHVVETLECGHTVEIFPQADPLIAQRRRCHDCDELPMLQAPKKPSVSVRLMNVERKRA